MSAHKIHTYTKVEKKNQERFSLSSVQVQPHPESDNILWADEA